MSFLHRKCNANLDKNVKFSKLSVNCEGYDYPTDPYIIAGSCGTTRTAKSMKILFINYLNLFLKLGLEYSLAHRDHYSRSVDESSSSMPFWIFVGFIGLFVFIMFCKSSDESSRESQGYNYRGFPSAPPQPGFRADYSKL